MEIILILGCVAILVAGLGIYIWKKEATNLLSNFPKDPSKIRDRKGLARWAGQFLLVLSILLFLEGVAIYTYDNTPYEWLPIAVFIPLTSLLTIGFLVGGQRFIQD
ncbi:DUF3784 domain-containing protein [Arundinibacter roseus]|uniref:DUF3784 domain-containing protein n=1 Tax=Arundinibacter roseus TaxID=2070510 RepID=A0A4R4KQ91_9BACT|nr:DUF3784 domain-containing protein [Arundinibacter roseus]TDB69126.1 DUF3784 domain-containing protein [Arundinibacter roseus]